LTELPRFERYGIFLISDEIYALTAFDRSVETPVARRLASRVRTGAGKPGFTHQFAERYHKQKRVLALPGSAFVAPPDHLALRLSVCDYKGAEALAACTAHEINPDQVADFAPRVVAAVDAIAAFAKQAGGA
jgi:aspartate/methionine/tyrosine aminotransferase